MFMMPGNPYVSYMNNLKKDSEIHNYRDAFYNIERKMESLIKEIEDNDIADIDGMDAKAACIKGANLMYSIFMSEKQRQGV